MRITLSGCFLLGLTSLSGCAEPELTSLQGYAQGTTYSVSYWSETDIPKADVSARVTSTLARIDRELSNYRKDSAIERFNRADRSEPVAVPASLVKLVRTAQDVSRKSQGCYDLTIRPLFSLWGFDDEFRVPAPEEVQNTLNSIGLDKLTVTDGTHLVKAQPEIAVDVSSIAQGYSTAQIGRSLQTLGIQNYLVEVGGELLVKGGKPNGEPWRVAIERPLAGKRKIQKIIEIKPGGPLSVVTSGTYRHYYDRNGQRYSHILDARTGAPVEHDLLSVTVLHPSPTLADAWSTALLCLGTEEALQTADRHGLAVMLIEAEGEGWQEYFSPSFKSDRWQVQDVD